MGKAFTFQCKNCGHVLKFYFGIGAMYPEKYQEIINDALIGNLGKEIQKFLIENADGAINISRVLANCENCGNHEMVRDLTMYLPEKNFSSKIKLQCPNCDSEMFPKKTAPKHWD